jgi:biotin-(acetyl-CoA carboxylase) ligase
LSRRGERFFIETVRRYDEHHALIARHVTVTGSNGEAPVRGKCEGLDSHGRLLLRERGKLHRVIAGQVQLDSRGRK